ncbi:hypothetical protein DFH06DRAFT_979959 [Mycena polygramma]|nr:hypothetical protein DFH06DRAFT_979959 [Mycena polygramma]
MQFVFRVTFALEAHLFWIPTDMYREIMSETPVARGVKSLAFTIPDELNDGPLPDRIISIQAAFIRPKWTLIFVDHNSMIQFHVMEMAKTFTATQLVPGSETWSALWSRTHGPVYSQEPEATLAALYQWRTRILSKPGNRTSIFQSMKSNQWVFNGSGAQEATDQLLLACILPQMPAVFVCQHDEVWQRFERVFIEYDTNRTNLAAPGSKLPYVSGPRPFVMKSDAHKRYLNGVLCYRRSEVIFDAEHLRQANELNLFQPNAVVGPNGRAEGLSVIPNPRLMLIHSRIQYHAGKSLFHFPLPLPCVMIAAVSRSSPASQTQSFALSTKTI